MVNLMVKVNLVFQTVTFSKEFLKKEKKKVGFLNMQMENFIKENFWKIINMVKENINYQMVTNCLLCGKKIKL